MKIYQVDTKNGKLDFKANIVGGKNESYDYQRAIIFSTGDGNFKVDYGLYILGGKFYLGEIFMHT